MKKISTIILASLLVLGLVGCKGEETPKEKEKVTLTVWGSQEDQEMLKGMVDSFKAAYPEKEYTINFGVVSEADAKTKVLEDPAAAADVFSFANDQIRELVGAGALAKIGGEYRTTIEKDNVPGSVEASMIGEDLYAFPSTADNGYFMYYNKSVIADPSSLDTILNQAQAAGKKVFMDVSNGWYIASFFLGNGCTFKLTDDGKQELVDFASEKGYKAAEAIQKFVNHPAFITGDDNVLKAGMADGSIVAGVSGTWNAQDISKSLGDNYAASKLPTYTVDGKQVQMGSFGGYKLVGVNSQSKAMADAMKLAAWLTNEQNQVIRFEQREMGPSNIKAAESDAVKANVALAALAQQSAFATSQKDVSGSYWTPAESLGTQLESKDLQGKTLQQLVDEMVAQATK